MLNFRQLWVETPVYVCKVGLRRLAPAAFPHPLPLSRYRSFLAREKGAKHL